MKKMILMGSMFAFSAVAAQAEGYIGASLGRGKMSLDCEQGASCKESANVFKLYAATKLSEPSQLDLGIARLDGFEVAYVRTVNNALKLRTVQQQGIVLVPSEFEGDPPVEANGLVNVPMRQRFSVDAIVMAPVLHAQLTNDLRIFVKPGLGVVTATIDTDVNGQSTRSDSSIRVKPYIAFGVDYAVAEGVKIFGSAEWLGYAVQGGSGTLRSVNMGAQVDF